jgi:hypothetical protein
MKRKVFKAYGLTGNGDGACVPDGHGRRCEVDHLISRELGGADEIGNSRRRRTFARTGRRCTCGTSVDRERPNAAALN